MTDKPNGTMTSNTVETSPEVAAKSSKEARKKKQHCIAYIILWLMIFSCFCGWETLLLRNVPLLVAFLIFMGGLFLCHWGVTKIFPKGWKQVLVFITGIYIYVAVFVGLMNLLPITAISEKTTWLTEPRTADGKAIDLQRAVAERFLPDCPPEQNGFRQVVEKFGFSRVVGRLPEDVHDDICRRLHAELKIDHVPQKDDPPQVRFETEYDFFAKRFEEQIEAGAKNDAEHMEQVAEDDAETEETLVPVQDVMHIVRKATNQLYYLPWPDEHRETALQWLAENEAAFDAFAEAVRMPEYFVPFFQDNDKYSLFEQWSGYAYFHREMVRGLRLRMLHRLERGDVEGAKNDLLTINRLAEKLLRHPRTTTNLLFARDVKNGAVNATLDMLQYGQLHHEQLTLLQQELAESHYVFLQSDIVFLMRMEGMHTLYFVGSGNAFLTDFERHSRPEMTEDSLAFEKYLTKYFYGGARYIAWTTAFQNFNEKMNKLETIAEMSLSPEQLKRLDHDGIFTSELWDPENGMLNFIGYILKKGIIQGIPVAIGSIMTELTLEASKWTLLGVYRSESQSRMLEIAFALEHYFLDHDGAYPETLDALTGEYVAQLPTDPYTDGEAFRYRPQKIGDRPGYVLYGIGVNMQDDNGISGTKVDPETEEEHRGDDCVIEMPRPRDAC